ncbi:Class E vacuolar protein-sorting machinery protein hse1 [Teratosphaeria destructans]|uniref:Class E vacuolar protein-sorting machinery protein HSE1 n=1 Tax=Teratosphaeria destructans TaxID=418781 RepID=A0A9W7W3Z7_9PEZI|nr:Class E vacuolar protein-sorting machinery protein hse1 [Teratosphaeria destructans]
MFRTQANPMDDAVVKATDENLTSEDWSLILDVCDGVSASPSGPAQAVSSLIKRLAHRNANVQLYTLELAHALSQNCGADLHRELASKAFTDALLRLAADRNTHAQVKQKVLERMGTWTEEFARNPDLGIMEQSYHKLRMQQPGLQPPSKPGKREISHEDRRKEEEELQMALALSVQDKGGKSPLVNGSAGVAGAGATMSDDDTSELRREQTGAGAGAAAAQGTTAATVSRVRALYDFTPSEPGELAFRKDDIIAVLESVYKDWWKGSLRGQTGIFPLNYVEKLQDPTREELERDAQMEAEVFGEIKNVEKLLALLSVGGEGGGRRGEREEEEIGELYQRTLSIRPKLIELIGKYSQKKDDFTQLNEKFIKARRDYEALLESSMSAPQYQQQHPIRQRHPSYPQQPPYGGPQQPPAAYPPQGYPTQQPYAAQSQQHLSPAQQDTQRFYSSSASDPPGQAGPSYASPYPAQDAPPSMQPPNGGAAPFHFIPGGLQAPPPQQQQPLQGPPPQQDHARRKPSPGQLPHSAGNGPSDLYSAHQGFQGQIRPNSIHTLNSGQPQELATGGYESPIDNRCSYAGPSGYDLYPPQPQASAPASLQPQPTSDRDGLPSASRQRTHSFESPTSLYSQQTAEGLGGPPYSAASVPPPPQPSGPPPSIPTGHQTYQAYQPGLQQQQQQRVGSGQSGGDPGDFYR